MDVPVEKQVHELRVAITDINRRIRLLADQGYRVEIDHMTMQQFGGPPAPHLHAVVLKEL